MVKHILQYLKATTNHGLQISRSISHSFQAFSDADWVGKGTDWRSTRGYAIFLDSNLISWASCKPKIVVLSSIEFEYKALDDTLADLIQLESLFQELGDNIWATYLWTNPIFHAHMKHMEIDFYFVHENVV